MSSSFLNHLIYGTANDEKEDDAGNTLSFEDERHGFVSSSPLGPDFSVSRNDRIQTKEETRDGDYLDLGELSAGDAVVDTVEAVTTTLDVLYAPSSNGQHGNSAGVFENPLFYSFPGPKEQQVKEENQKEQELNELRNKRSVEWRYARERWKCRRINLTEERDVGNAIGHQTRKFWSARKRQIKAESQQSPLGDNPHATESVLGALTGQKRKRASFSSSQGGHKIKDDGEAVLDSSDDEQEQILQRLTQSQPDEEPSEKEMGALDSKEALAARKLEAKLEMARISHIKDLNYWELGNIAPRDKRMYFLPPLETIVSGKFSNRQSGHVLYRRRIDGRRPIDGMVQGLHQDRLHNGGVVLAPLYGKAFREDVPDANTFMYFPLNHSVQVDKEFLHCRQLVRIAKRFIVGSVGQMWMPGHEDRLLQILWGTQEQNIRLVSLLTQTQQLGINMETLLTQRWKDDVSRALVANALGTIDTRDHNDLLGPSQMTGRLLVPQEFRALYMFERKSLIDLYCIGAKRSDGSDDEDAEGGKRNDVKDGSLIRPSVGYIHVSDTVPPSPTLPLGESCLLFGPKDKHTAFRHVGAVDEVAYKLTLSSLLTRVSSVQAGSVKDTIDDELLQDLQEKLRVLVEDSTSAARKMVNKLVQYRKDAPISEIPLVQYYRSIMFFCSFAASGCPQLVDNREIDLGDDNDDDKDPYGIEKSHRNEGSYKMEVLPMDSTAKKIYGLCENHLGHVGLQAFPQLHITHGLVCIARMLPPSAAEIVSRPLDDWGTRTPFDIFRCLLEHMEGENMLVGNDGQTEAGFTSTSSVIQVAELEYTLHQAASIFAKCIERDPVEVNNHAWYLGALASCLLLCSGNRIGSKTLPFPASHYSADTANENEDLFAGIANDIITTDSPRTTLPKFADVRSNVKKALKLCLHLTHRQEGSARGHLIISSFLEWKQVVALLAGSSCQKKGRLKELRTFHHRHATNWAISDKSKTAMDYLRRLNLSVTEGVPFDTKIRKMASAIDDDPDNVGYWRDLVEALGPIGVLESNVRGQPCAGCSECNMLHEGLVIDHSDIEARKRLGLWWGLDSVSWWYPHFLGLDCREVHEAASSSELGRLSRVIRDNLPRGLEMHQESAEACTRVSSQPDPAWLFDDTDNVKDLRKSAAWQVPVEALPRSFTEVLERGPAEPQEHTRSSEDDVPPSRAEGLYLRLAVTCHLLGLAHPGLYSGVYAMARNSVDEHFRLKDNGYWLYLQKLSRMGLDVSCFIERIENSKIEYK